MEIRPQTPAEKVLLVTSPSGYVTAKAAEKAKEKLSEPAEYADNSLAAKLSDEYRPQTKGEQLEMCVMPGVYFSDKFFKSPVSDKSITAKILPRDLRPQTKGEAIAMHLAPTSYLASKAIQQGKKDPVKKGAAIGAGVQLGIDAAAILGGAAITKSLTKSGTFKENVVSFAKNTMERGSKMYGGKNKFIACCIASVAICSLIGAGIGKLVKNHQEFKQAKQDIEDLKASEAPEE